MHIPKQSSHIRAKWYVQIYVHVYVSKFQILLNDP